MSNQLRLFWWVHALGVASFYIMLWLRTRSKEPRLGARAQSTEHAWPRVSVIVPARNEERNIERSVTSLLEQAYPTYEVIVVDDASSDDTACILTRIASTHPQGAKLRVLHVDALPRGWAGKPHALHTGAQEAQGDFLLFTDADTWHAPEALRAAVARAEERQIDLLSLGTEQELPSFWERVLMPLAYLGIGMHYPPRAVNDPRNPLALANGQYILLRRSVYEQLGGYARPELRGTLLDDRDLAILIKKHGYTLELIDGSSLVKVRMYHTLRETWRGWRKNVFLGSRGGLPFALLQILGLPMVVVLPFFMPLWIGLVAVFGQGKRIHASEVGMLGALELGPLLVYRLWLDKRLRVPWYYMFTHPLAGIVFAGILAQSTWRVVTGQGVDWSGRSYFRERESS